MRLCSLPVLVLCCLCSTVPALATRFDSTAHLARLAERSAITPFNLIFTIPPAWTKWGDGRASDWALPEKRNAWVSVDKIRGVNLGGLFIVEPWMARGSWASMGCGNYDSEWECNEANGMAQMQSRYEDHWYGRLPHAGSATSSHHLSRNTFYQEEDFIEMKRLGLNTIRIPLGCEDSLARRSLFLEIPTHRDYLNADWIVDDLIGSDPFASGGMFYLKRVLRWSRDHGLFALLDLHGAPGSQTVHQSFTGHTVDKAGFYSTANYQKAWDCLRNLTIMSHTDEDFSNDLTTVFYPTAQQVVRDAEKELGVNCLGYFPDCLTLLFMDTAWGSGSPELHLKTPDYDHVAYDSHTYAQWLVQNATREGYLEYLSDMGYSPVITGEWSISTLGGGELDPSSEGAQAFFSDFAAAAIVNAEKGA
ncbi:hypothetical protein JCM11491_003494 [Sporobolomyces phaffii]